MWVLLLLLLLLLVLALLLLPWWFRLKKLPNIPILLRDSLPEVAPSPDMAESARSDFNVEVEYVELRKLEDGLTPEGSEVVRLRFGFLLLSTS